MLLPEVFRGLPAGECQNARGAPVELHCGRLFLRIREHRMLQAEIDVASLHHVGLRRGNPGPGLEVGELDHGDRLSCLAAKRYGAGRATEGFLAPLLQCNHLAARMEVALANPTAMRPGALSPLPGGVDQASNRHQQGQKDDFLGRALHGNDSRFRRTPCHPLRLPLGNWCPGPESNRYGGNPPKDFKSFASTNFATQAYPSIQSVGELRPSQAKCSRYSTLQTKLSIGPKRTVTDSRAGCNPCSRFVVWKMPTRERGRPARTMSGTASPVSAACIDRQRCRGSPWALRLRFTPKGPLPACNLPLTLRDLQPEIRLRAGRPRSRVGPFGRPVQIRMLQKAPLIEEASQPIASGSQIENPQSAIHNQKSFSWPRGA